MQGSLKTAAQLLQGKRSGVTGVVSVTPDETVEDALRTMAEKDLGAVMVCEGGRIAGILSERDYARKVELRGATAKSTRVRDIMTAGIVPAQVGDDVAACRRLMLTHGIRHLPVCDGERIVGVLSIREVLDHIIEEEEHQIHDMENERLQMTTSTGSY